MNFSRVNEAMMYRALMQAAALSLATLTSSFPLQAQEPVSDSKTCALVESVVQGVGSRGPQQIDRWTRLDGVEINCPHREITFHQTFSAPSHILADGWKARLAQSLSILHCGPTGPLSAAVRHGWSVGVELMTDKGLTKIMANCQLPEA
jgi:hypothetical protein